MPRVFKTRRPLLQQNTMGLKIAQINAQRSRAAAVNLELIFNEYNIDILCIQKPYSYKGRARGYTAPGLRVIQPDKENSWVAAVVRESKMDVFQNTDLESEHVMCLQVCTRHEQFYIINMYCQFSLEIRPFLDSLGDILRRLAGNKIILTMDANAKSDWWYSGITDDRGKELEEFIMIHDLRIINRSSNVCTYMTDRGESNIDITLASESLAGNIRDWKVDSVCTTSDHNLIIFEFGNKVQLRTEWSIQNGYNLRKANWDRFRETTQILFNDDFLNRLKNSSASKSVQLFNKTLRKICDKSIPRRKLANRTVPWWNEKLSALRTQANKAKKHLSRAKRLNLENVEEYAKLYRGARNSYVLQIKKDKTAAWRSFVTKTANEDPWSIAYKIVRDKIKKPNYFCTLTKPSGEQTKDWAETINALLDKCVPSDNKEREGDAHTKIRAQNKKYRNCNMEQEISEAEVTSAIKKIKNNKAPGADGVQGEILKMVWANNKEALTQVLNNCLRDQTFPEEWRVASLRIILKDSKKDRSKLNSYRPIALLPVAAKVFERILIGRIARCYKEMGLESSKQFGFKPGCSTEDALIAFKKGLDTDKKYVVALFVDIEGAFDNLWWPAIKSRLVKANCSSTLINIIDKYFSKRKVIVKSNFKEAHKYMQKGCPQGSIIGPTMWNFCMDALLHQLAEIKDVETIAYADDLAMLIGGNSRLELEKRGADVIKTINDWCEMHKLKISATKTTALLMRGKLDKERMPRLKIEQQNIKYASEVRYLGVLIDGKLSFVTHARYLRDKLTKFMMQIRRIARDEWGLKKNVLNILYRAVAVPITTYAAALWYDKVSRTLVKRHILAAQRTLLMVLTKACKTTSTSAMQVISGLMPLDLEIIQQGLISSMKKNINVKWKNYSYEAKEDIINRDEEEEANLIKKEVEEEWQNRWTNDEHGRTTHQFIKEVTFAKQNSWFKPSKECTYILTGYGPINSTLFERGASEVKECPICGEDETSVHILQDCTGYDEIRDMENIERKDNMTDYISNEEDFNKLSRYIAKAFEARKVR